MKIDNESVITGRIAILFKAIRLNRQMNQQQLSDLLGISQSAISKVEAGALQPSVFVWLRFCELFELRSDLPLRAPLFNSFVTSCKPKVAKTAVAKKKYA